MKKDIEEIRGYPLSKDEENVYDEIKRIGYAVIDEVLSINPVYSSAKLLYQLKNNQRIEDRVKVLESRLTNNKLSVRDSNVLELFNLINNFLYAPQEMDRYVLDNIIDILNSDTFDNESVEEFLNHSIYDINKIKRLSETIFYDERKDIYLMVPNVLGEDLQSHMAQLKMLELRNYVFMSGAPGITIGTKHENGYSRLQLSKEGIKFFSLFFRKELIDSKKDINTLTMFYRIVNEDGSRAAHVPNFLSLDYSDKVLYANIRLLNLDEDIRNNIQNELQFIFEDTNTLSIVTSSKSTISKKIEI